MKVTISHWTNKTIKISERFKQYIMVDQESKKSCVDLDVPEIIYGELLAELSLQYSIMVVKTNNQRRIFLDEETKTFRMS